MKELQQQIDIMESASRINAMSQNHDLNIKMVPIWSDEMDCCRSRIGILLNLSTMVSNDICRVASTLSLQVAELTEEQIFEGKCGLRYLKGAQSIGLILNPIWAFQ